MTKRKPRAIVFKIPLDVSDEGLVALRNEIGRHLRPTGCTCEGHRHNFGTAVDPAPACLVPACVCRCS